MTMKPGLHIAVFAILASFCANAALAKCVSNDPTEVAKAFFTQHSRFHVDDPSKVKGLVTPRFFNALAREFKCAQGEICAIEAVPWTDAQDGAVGQPVVYKATVRTPLKAEVQMNYPFVLSTSRTRPQSALMKFERASDQTCWLLSDLAGPRGKSLVVHLETWHKQYGNGL